MLVTFTALLDADAHSTSHAGMKQKEIEAGQKEISLRKKPAYLSGAIIPSWKDNWFVSVSGGASSFIGSPLGCDDLFWENPACPPDFTGQMAYAFGRKPSRIPGLRVEKRNSDRAAVSPLSHRFAREPDAVPGYGTMNAAGM